MPNLQPEPHKASLFQKPSVSGARYWAREHAIARMIEAGRAQPNSEDEAYIRSETARLLWHVEDRDGGFCGLSDRQIERRADELRLSLETVIRAAYAPGKWPSATVAKAA